MRKLLCALFLFSLSGMLFGQEKELSEDELRAKLDSVLNEGNLLYRYEKSAWISSDLAMANPDIKEEVGGYITYEEGGEIRAVFYDGNSQICLAEYTFLEDFTSPKAQKLERRELSEKEKKLIGIRELIIANLYKGEYEILIPDGYRLNLILLPYADKYKLYIITGALESNVIPFGNDYIFIADQNGVIEYWHKFHTRLIPTYTSYEGEKVRSMTHSHVKGTPLISATDICTFKLYAPLYGIDTFSVYSPAIGKYMEYNLIDNKITIKERQK